MVVGGGEGEEVGGFGAEDDEEEEEEEEDVGSRAVLGLVVLPDLPGLVWDWRVGSAAAAAGDGGGCLASSC